MRDFRPKGNVTIGGVVYKEGNEPTVVLRTPSAGTPEYSLPLPNVLPSVGEVVLFCLGPNLLRPLLIVNADPITAKVSGIVFVNGDADRGTPWIKKYAFSPPTKQAPWHFVESAVYGDGEGQWRRRAGAPLESLKSKLVDRNLGVDSRMSDEDDE